MSQKGEKYARRMERRVDKLEQDVAAITTEQTTQGVRISAVEDDLAVYRAAVSARELKQAAAEVKAAKERRTARAAERERKARRRNKVLAFIALALFVAVCVVMVAKAYSEEPAAEPAAPEASAAPAAILPTELLFTAAAEEEYMEDPQETEKIEEALLAQGYFSLAVPMPYEWQDYMRTYCEEYGCPYPLALAVAQTESNFDMDAVGAAAGLCCMARKRGKQAQGVIDLEHNAAGPVLDRLRGLPEYAGVFTAPNEAFLKMRPGALLIVVPAAFNMTTGPAHWELLFRARALDNQCFVAGCAPARDETAGYVSYAHSLVCDPWGRVQAQAEAAPELLICDIDLSETDAVRAQIPVLRARRTDLYQLKYEKDS